MPMQYNKFIDQSGNPLRLALTPKQILSPGLANELSF
jgi:hypothetical protein